MPWVMIGIGYSGLENFVLWWIYPKPMTRNYDNNLLRGAVKSVAETSMKNAAPGIESTKYEQIGHVQKGLDAGYKMLQDEIKVSVVNVNFP